MVDASHSSFKTEFQAEKLKIPIFQSDHSGKQTQIYHLRIGPPIH